MASNRRIVFGAPALGREEIAAVVRTLRSGWIGTGPRTRRFEEAFRRHVGARHAVAVASGTAALHLSMLAAGIGPGDEVVTTPLTFCATANAVIHAGARPVFADVDRRTQNIDPGLAARAVTGRTRALLPVHLAGRPCDLGALGALARRRGLVLVEDAAHALGAVHGGKRIGTIGDLTCFSFYVTKNLTTGEGGMVTTADPRLAARIKTHSLHGLTHDAWRRHADRVYTHYDVVSAGFKYNLIDLHAAIGLVQLKRQARWRRRRLAIWRHYLDRFHDLPVVLPDSRVPGGRHALHLFTVHLDLERLRATRDGIMHALWRRGVGTGVHYRALPLHPFYRRTLGVRPEDYPNARWISERTLSLPLSPALTDGDVERVVGAFRAVVTAAARRAT